TPCTKAPRFSYRRTRRQRPERQSIGCTRPSEFPRRWRRPEPANRRGDRPPRPGKNSTAKGDEDDIDDEQHDDEELEDEESTRFELGLRDFVDLAEVLHLLLDDLPPGVELELPHARPIDLPQEPVSPQLGDVVDLEGGLSEGQPDVGDVLNRRQS